MDDESGESEKQEDYQKEKEQQFSKPTSWINRAMNAGIVGGSESNIKQLQHFRKTEFQHKSDVLIAKNKVGGRKNVVPHIYTRQEDSEDRKKWRQLVGEAKYRLGYPWSF